MVLEEIHQESRKNTASEYINLTVTQMTIYRTFQLTVCNSYFICVFTITSIDSGRWRKSSGSSEWWKNVLSAARGLFVNLYNVALLSCCSCVMIIVHTIHVQYLCKGGTKLLQRQFERLLASKQLKRPPEGDLIAYALPSISSVIHSYCTVKIEVWN